jgi:hypothetical protein
MGLLCFDGLDQLDQKFEIRNSKFEILKLKFLISYFLICLFP